MIGEEIRHQINKGIDMGENKVFMIMPFNEDIFALYEELKRVFEEIYIFKNGGDLGHQQSILKDIVSGITEADVIIADLTGLNPNVFYELGIAHSMNKKVILITQDLSEIPFDLKPYRAKEYNLQFNKLPIFIDEIKETLLGASDGSIIFGNPVSDFSTKFASIIDVDNKILKSEIIENSKEASIEIETGLYDNIVDIELSINEVVEILNNITQGMTNMTEDVNSTSADITRFNNTGPRNISMLIRNATKKLSTPINDFSLSFKTDISKINSLWKLVEDNTLLLIDNRAMGRLDDVNKFDSIVTSFESLYPGLKTSYDSMELFNISVRGCIGFEQNLNAALKSLDTQVTSYLQCVDIIKSSIDRIISKAELMKEKNT